MAQQPSNVVVFNRRQTPDINTVQYRRVSDTIAGDSYSLVQRVSYATGAQANARNDKTFIKLNYLSAADPITGGRVSLVGKVEFSFPDTVSAADRESFIGLLAAHLGDPEMRSQIARMQLPGTSGGALTIDGTKISSDSGQVITTT